MTGEKADKTKNATDEMLIVARKEKGCFATISSNRVLKLGGKETGSLVPRPIFR